MSQTVQGETMLRSLGQSLPDPALRILRSLKTAALSRYWRHRNVAKGSLVRPSAQGIGWQHIKIGQNVIISDDCWLNVNSVPEGQFALIIGDNSFIGRRNIISSGSLLEMGEYCLTAADCRFIGADHVFTDPFVPYVTTGTNTKTISIGPNCWFGVGATVVGDLKIGHGSIVGALSLINRDVPPFSIAVGNPFRIVKRFDPEERKWVPAETFNADKERLLPDERTYLEYLHTRHPRPSLPRRAAGRGEGETP